MKLEQLSYNKNKIINNIELVSIHIPKTAGTSFRSLLKEFYGSERAVRFDIDFDNGQVLIENEIFNEKRLPKNIRVIHGHFYYNDLIKNFEIKSDVPIITWLRDPVQRVISNYYYLAERLKEELDEQGKGLDILSKMQKSLIEYAELKLNQNRMAKFLDGITIEEMKFVGLQEYYYEDLDYFSKVFGFEQLTPPKHNETKEKRAVNPEIMKRIEELNARDVEIYKRGMELRKKRIKIN